MASSRQPRLALVRSVLEAQQRERHFVLQEVLKVRGLMPLLMKQRNGLNWTAAERRELIGTMRALSNLSPYLFTLALPGSMLILPLLAWWLDRRRGQRSH
ncbi:MAG: hypothetical protein IPG33_15490 [Betaproteobacteria bacterium]|nr:hypothetical protein [Betaproteobacteria bacterium]